MSALPEWMVDTPCAQADPDEWHPEKAETGAQAKRVCRTCPHVSLCLEWALETRQPHGVWGGLSANQRSQLLGVKLRPFVTPVEADSRVMYLIGKGWSDRDISALLHMSLGRVENQRRRKVAT